LSGGKDATSGGFDHSLGLRSIVLLPSVNVPHIDLRDVIDRRLGLSVKSLDGRCPDGSTREH
jgi:hypothetical protein